MQVLTLDRDGLMAHASALAEKVAAGMPAGGYDAVVGVRRGGSVVCDEFMRAFPKGACGFRTDVSLQRPSSKHKTPLAGRLLRRLPYGLLDLMRMAEAFWLERKHRRAGAAPPQPVALSEGLRQLLAMEEAPAVLLIDDAIDSGDTLFSIIHSLKKMNPAVRVEVAVVTVTTPAPRVKADFTIYHDRVLVRFPWSSDYKK